MLFVYRKFLLDMKRDGSTMELFYSYDSILWLNRFTFFFSFHIPQHIAYTKKSQLSQVTILNTI